MSDGAALRSGWTAAGVLLLTVLIAGCGEVAVAGDAAADTTTPQMTIDEIIAAVQAATPNPVTPEAVAETFALGTNSTNLQRETMKADLVGSVVEWDLVVYDVELEDGKYVLTSEPIPIQSTEAFQLVRVVAYLQSQGPEDDAFLRSVKTGDPIRIRGLVQGIFLRTIVKIGPGVVVGSMPNHGGTAVQESAQQSARGVTQK